MVHRARAALVTAVGVAALCWAGWTLADEAPPGAPFVLPPQDASTMPPAITAAVAAGRHVRIDGPHGSIHVWIPPSFQADTGATIVYLHGYYDDADTSYIGHRLPEQFAMSALNAMFIVAETPVAAKTPINYPSLGELLQLVEEKTGTSRGMALTVVVGHSGAFRTIDSWLDEPLVDELVMIDSMYGNEEQIEAWMRASPHHKLITVGEDTLIYNENLLRALPDTLVIDRVPTAYGLWPAEVRTARSVYIRAQFMHMPLVTDGVVLPGLLRLLPVPLLPDEPWTQPLGSLAPT